MKGMRIIQMLIVAAVISGFAYGTKEVGLTTEMETERRRAKARDSGL